MEANQAITGLEQFKKDFKPFVGNPADWERVDAALKMLKRVAQVVRCKDCKFGYDVEVDGKEWIYCRNLFACGTTKHEPSWFCADGRKEGKQCPD